MSEIKSLIDYDIIENIDHSAICVKFAMMSKQIEEKDKEIEKLNNIINNDDVYGYIKHLEDLITKKDNIINELKWKPIEEYDKGDYDWVLVKYFDDDYECIPCVAEKRFGKWHSIDEKEIQFDVKYFMDIQQLDKLQELKGDNKK